MWCEVIYCLCVFLLDGDGWRQNRSHNSPVVVSPELLTAVLNNVKTRSSSARGKYSNVIFYVIIFKDDRR